MDGFEIREGVLIRCMLPERTIPAPQPLSELKPPLLLGRVLARTHGGNAGRNGVLKGHIQL